MRAFAIPALLAVLSIAAASSAQPQPPQAPEEAPIIVEAPSRDIARAFVDAVTAVSPQRQMARWDRTVCTAMIGMRNDLARGIMDRMAQTITRVGLEVGGPGCEANVLIFYTRDSDALAQELASMRRVMAVSSPIVTSGNSLGRDALRDFADTPRPVRWWHVADTTQLDGTPVYGNGDDGTPTIQVNRATRMRRNTREDFDRVFIIIDADDISGVQGEALADYLAMVSLAQVQLGTDFGGAHTILGLFSEIPGEHPNQLTAWDVAYLEGLYQEADRDAATNTQQEHEIARHMTRELGGGN